VRIVTVVVIVGRQWPPAHENQSPVDNYNCFIRLPPLDSRPLVRIRSRPPRAYSCGGGSSQPRTVRPRQSVADVHRAQVYSPPSVLRLCRPFRFVSLLCAVSECPPTHRRHSEHYENRFVLRLRGARRSRVRRLVAVRVHRRRPCASTAAVRRPASRCCPRSWFVHTPCQEQTRGLVAVNIARRFRQKHYVQSEWLQTLL